MYRSLVLLITTGLVGACAGKPQIDPMFQPVLNQLQADADAMDKPFKVMSDIKFGMPNPGAFATCYEDIGKREIVVDKAQWDKANDSQRYWVIVHELGHCDMGMEHVDTVDSGGYPTHVMHTEALLVAVAAAQPDGTNKEFFLKQFFKNLF